MSKPSKMDDYNAVLDFKRIMDIKKGWGLELDDERQTKLASFILEKNIQDGQVLDSFQVAEVSSLLFGEKKTNVIITGLFNRGKTFVMNNITGLQFGIGLAVNTRGVSMIANCGEKSLVTHIFFDSAGTNVPLNSEMIQCERDYLMSEKRFTFPEQSEFPDFEKWTTARTKIQAKLDEKAIALATINKKNLETFTLDMIFDIGDVIVIVVNNMTWNDQQFIQAMNEKLYEFNRAAMNNNSPQKHAKILIVHNFKDVTDLETLEKLKEQYVTSCFSGSRVVHTVSIEGLGTKDIELFESNYPAKATHFFIGREGSSEVNSAAGDSNKFYFHKLRELIASAHVDSSKDLPFLTHVAKKIKHNVKKYFKNVFDISVKYENGQLVFFHPQELRFLSENIRVENFSLVSASSGYQPDIDVIIGETVAHILIDCPGMKFKRFNRNLELEMNEFTVQFTKTRFIIVKGKRSLGLLAPIDLESGKLLTTQHVEPYLTEDRNDIITEEEGEEWPVRNRKYGYFENTYEVNLEHFDQRDMVFHQNETGVLQISIIKAEE